MRADVAPALSGHERLRIEADRLHGSIDLTVCEALAPASGREHNAAPRAALQSLQGRGFSVAAVKPVSGSFSDRFATARG